VIERTGPAATAIHRWFDENQARAASARWIILAGLAGGLDPEIQPGRGYVISTVISHDDRRHVASISADECARVESPNTSHATATITSTDHVVSSPADRAALREATGAQLVDMESAAFAERAKQLGARWGIVRGVSDGVNSLLPRGLDHWVDESGRTRLGSVIMSLLRHPGDLPRTIALARASRAALRAIAPILCRFTTGALSQIGSDRQGH
jgi:adenosylhomocysteine nucleosidase